MGLSGHWLGQMGVGVLEDAFWARRGRRGLRDGRAG